MESAECCSCQVKSCDLQVASIEVALVERDAAVDCNLLGNASAHVVVGAFDYSVAIFTGECGRTIRCVVGDVPDACRGFQPRLVAVKVEFWCEVADGSVLVTGVGIVCYLVCDFLRGLAVADVVVIVSVVIAAHRGCGELALGVVAEAVVTYGALSCDSARDRATEFVIAVASEHDAGIASRIVDICDEVAIFLVGVGRGDAVRMHEAFK
ncbi:MAG: hypothetical protein SNG49_08730 [Rikenellaceae bacterium]